MRCVPVHCRCWAIRKSNNCFALCCDIWMCCGSAVGSVSSVRLFTLEIALRGLLSLLHGASLHWMLFLFFVCTVCLLFFYVYVICVRVCTLPHSFRKPSSWRESVTGSIRPSPTTPSQTPPSSTLTSTRRPRVWARRPTGRSPRQLRPSPFHPPRPPPWHLPPRVAASAAAAGRCLRSRRTGESRRSRENRDLSTRAPTRRMVRTSAWLKTNRLRQIKPLQQQQLHRVRLPTGSLSSSCMFILKLWPTLHMSQ